MQCIYIFIYYIHLLQALPVLLCSATGSLVVNCIKSTICIRFLLFNKVLKNKYIYQITVTVISNFTIENCRTKRKHQRHVSSWAWETSTSKFICQNL